MESRVATLQSSSNSRLFHFKLVFKEYRPFNCFPFGELEETTRTSSNYMDEDYPARPEIKQSLPG